MTTAKTAGFRWLPSYYEAIRDLPDAERLAMYDAIADFGFGNEPGELPPLLLGYFRLIEPTLAKSVRFEGKQKANGQKGGRPSKPRQNPDDTQNGVGSSADYCAGKATQNLDVDVDVAVADAVAVDERTDRPPRTRFSPPSLDDVAAYCRERANGIDAQRFLDYYAANGWVQGKGKPIRDWKACVRTWERSEHAKTAAPDMSWRTERPRWEADAHD